MHPHWHISSFPYFATYEKGERREASREGEETKGKAGVRRQVQKQRAEEKEIGRIEKKDQHAFWGTVLERRRSSGPHSAKMTGNGPLSRH